MDPLNLNRTAETLTKAVPVVADAVDRLGDKAAAAASGLQDALQKAIETGSIDAALLVNSALLELQAWRQEVAAWRAMIEPIARGVTVTVTPNPPVV